MLFKIPFVSDLFSKHKSDKRIDHFGGVATLNNPEEKQEMTLLNMPDDYTAEIVAKDIPKELEEIVSSFTSSLTKLVNLINGTFVYISQKERVYFCDTIIVNLEDMLWEYTDMSDASKEKYLDKFSQTIEMLIQDINIKISEIREKEGGK